MKRGLQLNLPDELLSLNRPAEYRRGTLWFRIKEIDMDKTRTEL